MRRRKALPITAKPNIVSSHVSGSGTLEIGVPGVVGSTGLVGFVGSTGFAGVPGVAGSVPVPGVAPPPVPLPLPRLGAEPPRFVESPPPAGVPCSNPRPPPNPIRPVSDNDARSAEASGPVDPVPSGIVGTATRATETATVGLTGPRVREAKPDPPKLVEVDGAAPPPPASRWDAIAANALGIALFDVKRVRCVFHAAAMPALKRRKPAISDRCCRCIRNAITAKSLVMTRAHSEHYIFVTRRIIFRLDFDPVSGTKLSLFGSAIYQPSLPDIGPHGHSSGR